MTQDLSDPIPGDHDASRRPPLTAAWPAVQGLLRRRAALPAQCIGAAVERLFYLSTRRLNRPAHQEHPRNSFEVAGNAALQALLEPTSALSQALATAGCAAWFAAEGERLTVRADAPLARELGRRLVTRLRTKPQIRPDTATRLLQGLQRDIDHEVIRAGRAAMQTLSIKRLHPELVKWIGCLTFRRSYGQNQWKHALETAELAGSLAAELGVDPRAARRAGLLHDIGKAMTHAREGAHAVLGAEAARRCGEAEEVANAVGAHHHDEPAQGPLAYLVAAADALSGARPGARREATEAYLARLASIEALVRAHQEVVGVDIASAGREVRVTVQGAWREPGGATTGGLDDAALPGLAQSLAQEIRHGVRCPGDIRVTVLRTSVATCTTATRHNTQVPTAAPRRS